MLIGHIEDATRVIGKCQGYKGLPLRDEILDCGPGIEHSPIMISAWIPTPAEVERIAQGAPVYLKVLGTAHPPVLLEVGNPPETT